MSTPTVTAKPITWDESFRNEASDSQYGFHISFNTDAKLFLAEWGEGDSEEFETLQAAKDWCQTNIDKWISDHAVIGSVCAPMAIAPTTTLVGQILVMATLLEKALRVVKNVEAEGSDEGEQLQALIDQGEAAIATVLKEHAMGVPSHG